MESLFSKIINGTISSYKIYEDDNYIAILDIYPKNSGHFLVIPKNYSKDLINIKTGEIGPLFTQTVKLANQVIKALGASGYQLHVNTGSDAGQEVMHTHIHVVPYYSQKCVNDKMDFNVIQKQIINNLS